MKIDFHIVNTDSAQRAWLHTCQLIEKAYAEQKRVYVHTTSRADAERFDALLWTYREDSFIPHNIYTADEAHPPAIQLGYDTAPSTHQDLLINVSSTLPSFYPQFAHVIEIVFTDPTVQQLARERFKQYRNDGHEITTYKHNI